MLWANTVSESVLYIHADRLRVDVSNGDSLEPNTRYQSTAALDAESEVVAQLSVASAVLLNEKRKKSGKLTVVVSDRWVTWFTVPWHSRLIRRLSAIVEYRAHAFALLGKDSEDLEFAEEYSVFGAPRIVAGLSANISKAIAKFAHKFRLELIAVRPLSCICWEFFRKAIQERQYGFAVTDGFNTTILLIKNGNIERAFSQRSYEAGCEETEKVWRRLHLRDTGLAEYSRLYVVDLSAGRSEHTASTSMTVLNLPRSASETGVTSLYKEIVNVQSYRPYSFSRYRTSSAGWARVALLALGAMSFALAAAYLGKNYNDYTVFEEQLHRSQQVPVSSAPRSAREQQLVHSQLQAVNQAIVALNVPIDTLFRVIQPTKGVHVALLGLDLSDVSTDKRTAVVRVTGEGRSAIDMTAYVNQLAEIDLFESVFLTKHEIVETDSGNPYRFVVEASWPQ